MNKTFKEKALRNASRYSVEELEHAYATGYSLILLSYNFRTFRQLAEELALVKSILNKRGIKVVKLNDRVRFEDALVHSPIKMIIPTVDELLALPLPPDLPKHGYLNK